MKGSREVLEMEENGEIELTDEGYFPVSLQEQQARDMHEMEMRNDALYQEEKERRARRENFLARHPVLTQYLKDIKNEQIKIDKIDQKIKELKNDNNR